FSIVHVEQDLEQIVIDVFVALGGGPPTGEVVEVHGVSAATSELQPIDHVPHCLRPHAIHRREQAREVFPDKQGPGRKQVCNLNFIHHYLLHLAEGGGQVDTDIKHAVNA